MKTTITLQERDQLEVISIAAEFARRNLDSLRELVGTLLDVQPSDLVDVEKKLQVSGCIDGLIWNDSDGYVGNVEKMLDLLGIKPLLD